MRKITKVLLVVLLLLIGTTVYADADYSYRTKRDNRVTVNVNNKKLYVSVSVLFNMEGDYSQNKIPVEKFDASWKNSTLYVSIKRSELNKVFKAKKYDNVYSLFEVSMDYLDANPSKEYLYFMQLDHTSKSGEGYSPTIGSSDYLYRNYKFFEVMNAAAGIQGLGSQAQASEGGGYLLYELDELPEIDARAKYNISDLNFGVQPIIKIDRTKAEITIIEDVQIDLGENEKIISSDRKVDKKTGKQETYEVDINNFYAEYLDSNKLNYSWTMYDKDGKPIKIDVDTGILMDKSENEEQIYSIIRSDFTDVKDRVKILSFKHEGDLGGTAKISLYVGDKFKPGQLITVFYYNPETLILESPNFTGEIEMKGEPYTALVDKDGYIAIEMTHCSEYVLAEEEVAKEIIEHETEQPEEPAPVEETKETKKDNKKLYVIAGAIGLAVLLVIIIVIVIIKKKKSKNANTVENAVVAPMENPVETPTVSPTMTQTEIPQATPEVTPVQNTEVTNTDQTPPQQ